MTPGGLGPRYGAKRGARMDLNGRRVVAIGEREGVTGPSLKLLAESAGAEVVFSVTQCFV